MLPFYLKKIFSVCALFYLRKVDWGTYSLCMYLSLSYVHPKVDALWAS